MKNTGTTGEITQSLRSDLRGKVITPEDASYDAVIELINAAVDVEDLRIPPGNRLERLVGDRQGQHSIRVNDQWRIVFRWDSGPRWRWPRTSESRCSGSTSLSGGSGVSPRRPPGSSPGRSAPRPSSG